MTQIPVEFLEWDSEFFGYRIARITLNHLNSKTYQAIQAWSTANQIDCIYFLGDSNHQATIQLAEQQSFNFVDIRMTLECKIPASANILNTEDMIIRESTPSDISALTAISGTAYQASRFYADPCFSKEKSSQLYQTWLKQSIESDYADRVIVAELNHQPLGYVTCHLNKPDGEGNIGLVGIAESAQGQGIGTSLIAHALQWFAEQDMKAVNVVTQGRNIAAQRLYQRSGFVTRSIELWYHQWLTNCAKK